MEARSMVAKIPHVPVGVDLARLASSRVLLYELQMHRGLDPDVVLERWDPLASIQGKQEMIICIQIMRYLEKVGAMIPPKTEVAVAILGPTEGVEWNWLPLCPRPSDEGISLHDLGRLALVLGIWTPTQLDVQPESSNTTTLTEQLLLFEQESAHTVVYVDAVLDVLIEDAGPTLPQSVTELRCVSLWLC
jgi:hypothetical protein